MAHRFLIAPDKFKGSLTAQQAAEAMAAGVREIFPAAEIDLCPIADGGEGTMEMLATILGGRWIECPAVDANGREIESRYLLAETSQGLTAILEVAETAGLWQIIATERNLLTASTRGVGMQMAHAIQVHKVARIILGLGGSATNDAGCGMAAALGVRFLTESGALVDPHPAQFTSITAVDFSSRISFPEIIAACDVEIPLLGKQGATAVFSAQKGATPVDQSSLEEALCHLVKICRAENTAGAPGAGAAGGLGFGLLHFAGAKIVSGFELLADLLNLKTRIAAADIVLTGEGSLDHQSLSGKGPVALAEMARDLGKPTIAYCGKADDSVRTSEIFSQIHALTDGSLALGVMLSQAATLLKERVAATQVRKLSFITEAEAMKENFKGRTNYWMCRPEITHAKDLQICRAVLPAGEGHAFHHHPELEEAIYILEGEVEQWVGREKRILKAGELAHISAGVVHGTYNVSQRDAVILAILSPGSQTGPFIVDVSDREPWASLR